MLFYLPLIMCCSIATRVQTQLSWERLPYGRNRPEFEDIIGYLVNIIALKADLSGDPTFRELAEQVKSRLLEAIQHQDYPFALLVEKLHPVRNSTHTPVFQSIFNLQKFRQLAGLKGFPRVRSRRRLPSAISLWYRFPSLSKKPR